VIEELIQINIPLPLREQGKKYQLKIGRMRFGGKRWDLLEKTVKKETGREHIVDKSEGCRVAWTLRWGAQRTFNH